MNALINLCYKADITSIDSTLCKLLGLQKFGKAQFTFPPSPKLILHRSVNWSKRKSFIVFHPWRVMVKTADQTFIHQIICSPFSYCFLLTSFPLLPHPFPVIRLPLLPLSSSSSREFFSFYVPLTPSLFICTHNIHTQAGNVHRLFP